MIRLNAVTLRVAAANDLSERTKYPLLANNRRTRNDSRIVTAALDQSANTQTARASHPVEMDHSVSIWGVKTYPGSKLGTGDHNEDFGYWGLQGSK